MASPSVTYTFANSTTADATQVNQNFTDLINGLSDGTKDLSISALTCAGAATLNGHVNLGNASGDDITITGSLASTIPIKTTNTYNIGSALLGLAGIYFGANSQTVRILGSSSMSATWSLTLPVSAGTSRYRLETDGAGVTSWQPVRRSASDAHNVGLAASVAASALTLALKGADGNDPSATNPVDIVFRSSTAATGTAITRTVTAATSLVISSGSTLGHTSGNAHFIYVYGIDNSGTVELAVSSSLYDDGTVVTTTAEGAAGAADSGGTIYSTTARAGVPLRLLARLTSTQATAGTWASVPSEISQIPFLRTFIKGRYTSSAGQSISNAATPIVDFGTKVYDTTPGYTVTGASWRFTAGRAMRLHIDAKVNYGTATFTAGNNVQIFIYKNGVEHSSMLERAQATVNSRFSPTISDTIDLAATDYFDIRTSHGESAARSLTTSPEYVSVSFYEVP